MDSSLLMMYVWLRKSKASSSMTTSNLVKSREIKYASVKFAGCTLMESKIFRALSESITLPSFFVSDDSFSRLAESFGESGGVMSEEGILTDAGVKSEIAV